MDLLKEELRASFIKEKRFLDTHTRIENLEIEIGICRRETIFFNKQNIAFKKSTRDTLTHNISYFDK